MYCSTYTTGNSQLPIDPRSTTLYNWPAEASLYLVNLTAQISPYIIYMYTRPCDLLDLYVY